MGIQDLQTYVETHCKGACQQADLVQVARGVVTRPLARRGGSKLRLVVDVESCLDRLYGGYYSDWACGGQWNRMSIFIRNLINACNSANMELVVFFNGSLETQRMKEWAAQQVQHRQDIQSILKHLHNKATPPPKVWWQPPPCLHTSLRMALRQLGVEIASSMDDHHQEVIGYCRENFMHGLMSQDSDYIIFDPPRYFSSHHLKMTYKGTLETVEYVVDEIAKEIDLDPKRFCILAALLGTHILPEEDMKDFFTRVCEVSVPSESKDAERKTEAIRAVISFVRALPSVENLDEVGKEAFKFCPGKKLADRINRFRESVQYYINGTQEGFLRYSRPKTQAQSKQPGGYPGKQTAKGEPVKKLKKQQQAAKVTPTKPLEEVATEPAAEQASTEVDVTQEISEKDKDLKADPVYTQEESGYAEDAKSAPEIVVDPPSSTQDPEEGLGADIKEKLNQDLEEKMTNMVIDKMDNSMSDAAVDELDEEDATKKAAGPDVQKLVSSSSGGSSPSRLSPENAWAEVPTPKAVSAKKAERFIPKISHDIMRIASDRHQKGLMSPWIYQLLTVGEIKIPVTLEDESDRELPPALDLYRPCRQRVYGILYEYNKQMAAWKTAKREKKDGSALVKPKILVKEWSVPRGRHTASSQEVEVTTVNWLAPGLHRLWLGTKVEEKNRRLRAFLSCMESDVPLMLNTAYVSQEMLIMCCVLRYMLLYDKQAVLRRYELDAFLCAALSPLLPDVDTMQEMKLPVVTIRGVQLASLFMRGVEHAVFANDACGAPIPWGYCCPWLFFDGKLFHFKLLKASNNTPLIDMCDGQVEQVMQVERMRQAILENIMVAESVFARPPLPVISNPYSSLYPPNMSMRPAGAPRGPPQMNRGAESAGGQGLLGRSPVDGRGGQLEIAGVVVGSWGANTHSHSGHRGRGGQGDMIPPHVTSVGPRSGRSMHGRGRATMYSPALRGRPGAGRATNYSAGRGKVQIPARNFYGSGNTGNQRQRFNRQGGKNSKYHGKTTHDVTRLTLEQRTKPASGGKGRGCTVETPEEVVLVSQIMAAAKSAPLAGDSTSFTSKDADMGQYEDVCGDNDLASKGGTPVSHTVVSGPKVMDPVTVAHLNGSLEPSGAE